MSKMKSLLTSLGLVLVSAVQAGGGGYDVSWEGRALCQEEARVSSVPMCRVWPGHQREITQTELATFVRFDVVKSGCLSVKAPGLAGKLKRILPLGSTEALTKVGTDEIRIEVCNPGCYVLMFDGVPDLHVFADPPLPRIPQASGSGKLIRFCRGEHHPGVVCPKSGDVVVLDEGAVVYGGLFVHNATNVTITGRGIFDASELERADDSLKAVRRACSLPEIDTESACFPYSLYGSENVVVSGVTFRDAPFWTLVVRNQCKNTLIDNIHIVGNWRYNSDGIDVCASANTVIRNSFIRTFDDCVIARGPYLDGEFAPVSNLLVSNCVLKCDWGAVVKAQVQDFHGSTIEDVLVKDCKFVGMQEHGFYLATRYGCDLDVIRNFRAEDIEFDFFPQHVSQYQVADGERFSPAQLKECVLILAYSYTLGKNLGDQMNGKMEDPNYYRFLYDNLQFRRFRAFGEERKLKVSLKTSVPRHEIKNVMLEDLPAHELETEGNVSGVIVRQGQSDAEKNNAQGMNARVTASHSGPTNGVRILFLGNSITLHAPSAKIGWTNNWGMAASSAESDYVHVVTREIERRVGRKANVWVRNLADFERNFETWDVRENLKEVIAFAPEYLVVALGENVRNLQSEGDVRAYRKAFCRLLSFFRTPGRHPKAVVRGVFWSNPTKDRIMSDVAAEFGVPFVKCDFSEEKGMMAVGHFAHSGVAQHPGDLGMAEMARRIIVALTNNW